MIRTVLENDLPHIWELSKLAPEFWRTAWCLEAWKRVIDVEHSLTLVWEEDGHILGFISAHDMGWPGYLCTLVIAAAARTRNIDRALIQCVADELAERGYPTVRSESIGMCQARDHATPDLILLRRACAHKVPAVESNQ